MAILAGTLGLLTLAALSYTALALPGPIEARITAAPQLAKRSCYSYTETVPYTGIEFCPLEPVCGPVPECIELIITTLSVPCANPRCPTTPTVTVTGLPTCPTCQTGCGKFYETATATTGCL